MTDRHALTILAVPDLQATTRFYRAAFAWPMDVDTPVYVEFLLPNAQRLGLYERQGFGKNVGSLPHQTPSGEVSSTELYFYCDSVEASTDRLLAAGANSLSPLQPRSWGDEVAYFADPNGVVLALARPAVTPT